MPGKPSLGVVLAALLTAWIAAGLGLADAARAECAAGAICAPLDDGPKGAAASSGEARPSMELPEPPAAAKAAGKKAKTLLWRFENHAGNRIDFKLYSKTRAWEWPGGGRVYYLPPDRRQYTSNISCKKKEKVCYGAWVSGDTNKYWGVGYGGTRGCTACCYVCGQTPTAIRLLP